MWLNLKNNQWSFMSSIAFNFQIFYIFYCIQFSAYIFEDDSNWSIDQVFWSTTPCLLYVPSFRINLTNPIYESKLKEIILVNFLLFFWVFANIYISICWDIMDQFRHSFYVRHGNQNWTCSWSINSNFNK